MKSQETFEQKLARSDPEFLEFLKGEKSDLLAFDDGDLSEDSNEDDVEQCMDTDDGHKSSKKKKLKVNSMFYVMEVLMLFKQ